jgi:hypothetical protein
MANDKEVDKAPHELLDSRLMPVSVNKASLVWQYFAMVKDGSIRHNGIQYIYYCLLCLKKRPCKFLDNLVTIYNNTTGNAHKHIVSTHPNLHLACKR